MKNRNGTIYNIYKSWKEIASTQGRVNYVIGIINVVFSALLTFATMALPSFSLYVLNKYDSVANILIPIAIYALLLTIISFIKQKTQFKLMQLQLDYRLYKGFKIQEKLLESDYINIDNPDTQLALNKANVAVYRNDDVGFGAICGSVIELLVQLLTLVIYASVTASLNVFILLVIVLTPLITIYANKKKIEWVEKNKDTWARYDKKMNYLKQQSTILDNQKDIRLFSIQKWFVDIYNDLQEKRLYWYNKEYKRQFLIEFTGRIVTVIQYGFIYTYLIYQAFHGMSISEFTLYIGTVSGIAVMVKILFDKYQYLSQNNISINDYYDFLNIKDNFKREDGIDLPNDDTYEFEFKNMSFKYRGAEEYTFKDLNLKIKKGEKIALVGENGAGKSTLVKLMCGLYMPTSGQILLNGVDIKEFNIKKYYDRFSVVFQDVFAFAFTIAQNVACSMNNIDDEKVYKSLELAGLKDKIDSLEKGIHTYLLKDINEDGILLSGGELQKLMLARALYKDSSKAVILDEPTSALDPIAEGEMYEKYNSLIQGKTSMFISHRLSSTKFCDRILFLKKGEIVETGTHDELIAQNGDYAHMFNIQSHYYQKEVKGNEEEF